MLVPHHCILVILHTISTISFHLWCMHWSILWVWMKINLIWFIEGWSHFSTSWDAKNEVHPQWTNLKMFFIQTSTLPLSMLHKLPRHTRCWMQNYQLQPNFINSLVAYLGPNSFQHLLACQNKFDPWWTNIEFSAFKPPHYLQTCTINFPNMKGVGCKTTNS